LGDILAGRGVTATFFVIGLVGGGSIAIGDAPGLIARKTETSLMTRFQIDKGVDDEPTGSGSWKKGG